MRIVIIEDHQIVKDGLKLILEREPRFSVVGEADNGKDAMTLIAKERPDLCLLDINLKNDSGLTLIGPILELSPKTKVAILSMHETAEFISRSFKAGASAFFPKGISPAILLKGLNAISEEKVFYLPGQKEIVENNLENTVLTHREVEILQLIAQGMSSKQIADKLKISYRTIETHRSNIFKKLNVVNSIEAVTKGFDLGLIQRE